MAKIECYSISSNLNNHPGSWPREMDFKPSIGDKIESLDTCDIGVISEIIYSQRDGDPVIKLVLSIKG